MIVSYRGQTYVANLKTATQTIYLQPRGTQPGIVLKLESFRPCCKRHVTQSHDIGCNATA
jgi:hypothetical protein